MLVAVIKGAGIRAVEAQVARALPLADVLELRLDYLEVLDLDALRCLRETCALPVIFTLRKETQGGRYVGDEPTRLACVRVLLALRPDYFDLEYDVAPSVFEECRVRFPATQLICSYHNFLNTPRDLSGIFRRMERPGVAIYKIATMARTTSDARRMLRFVEAQATAGRAIAGMCMGKHGALTRRLAPHGHSVFCYAALDEASAEPGQLTLQALRDA